MKELVVIFACAVVLTACGTDDDTPLNPVDPTPTATSTTKAAELKPVEIVIKDGKVTPQGDRVEVKVGEAITLRVTTDEADEIHVHSEPEHSYEVEPGDAKEFIFQIDTPGQIAVESHHLGVTIVQLVVRP